MNFIHDDSCKWTNGADQGWANSVSASRARILALGGDGSSTWNEEREKHNHEAYLENLKKCYSFETHYKNKGKWT